MKSIVFATAGIEAARIAGRSSEMDRVAAAMHTAFIAAAAPHTRTGNLVSSGRVRTVRGKRGVMDRLFEVTDPDAEHIEWGHVAGDGEGGLRWVPGLGIVAAAYRSVR